jgi:hypothetical protein
MRRKLKEPKKRSFIVVDEYLQAFCGLKGGYPQYDTDWDKAKPLSNNAQFDTLQRMSLSKLDMVDWD